MRLLLKHSGRANVEFQFTEGPIYIGRQPDSHIFLHDRAVSRQHAVITKSEDNKWMVEDLDSTNKTYLNEEDIHKAEIKDGDSLRIADFIIEIDLEDTDDAKNTTHMEDTLKLESSFLTPQHDVIIRRPNSDNAPGIRLPAKRLTDFEQAVQEICKANGLDEVLQALINVTSKQFAAYRVWCSLRDESVGLMNNYAGKRRDGTRVELGSIKLSDYINQAVEKQQFMVLPRVSAILEKEQRIRSAMIAPIMSPTGCFGVIYVDNTMDHEHYNINDLDYLMLIALHTAAIVENF